ncbi:MAG TPA: hypothetical protein VGQ57_06600, partial [Polyangiaceae bacterium]|nr:hypothetical protein [Polyangiaceae bacterium]
MSNRRLGLRVGQVAFGLALGSAVVAACSSGDENPPPVATGNVGNAINHPGRGGKGGRAGGAGAG